MTGTDDMMSDFAISLLGKWHGGPLVSIILQVVAVLRATLAPHKKCILFDHTGWGIASGIATDTLALLSFSAGGY